ncbi:MAG: M20/M25/M40 family metallo-hydrolase [Armatimonadia bacterium]|nr:M20/M25/M40 family metallo-hydrolase [Armatimonadia bacterium]
MRKESLQFLKDLIAAPSPSGFEQPAQRVVRARMEQFADEITTDVHGNVTCVKNPAHPFRVMLAGHVDQIGFIVRHINDDGYIYASAIGGIDASIVPGSRVLIHGKDGAVPGVFGRTAIHLLKKSERGKKLDLDKLFIDIGAEDKEAAEELVAVADPITFDAPFQELEGDLVAAAGFDDKMGTFVCMEALRILSDRDIDCGLHAVSTVQEEIGLRGARTSCYCIDPAAGIAVDVTHASDYPGCDKTKQGDIKIGGGPVIARGPNINPVMGQMLQETADDKGISIHVTAAPRGTGTDANAMQLSRAGVATGLVSVPNRYMHTPVEVISLSDLENAAKLVAETVAKINEDIDFTPM